MQGTLRRIGWSRHLAVLVVLSFALAQPSRAQEAGNGGLTGTVLDSVFMRRMSGVRVVAVGAGDRANVQRSSSTDSLGRYRIDSLPAGKYVVGFESPLLDSLEITVSPRVATVAAGSTLTLDLALPPAAKLRTAVCPGVALPPETGAILGRVVSAETESSLPGVTIAMEWREMAFDKAKMRPINQQRTASVVTDDGGWYRLCGVPTGTWLSMQLQYDGRSGPLLRERVGDTLGLAVRHLSFAPSAARAIGDTTSARVESSTSAPLAGTAKLSGVVLGAGGVPVAQADVRVRGTAAVTRTDERGSYSLAALPSGTQMLVVRHVGYVIAEMPVELRDGITTTSIVRLERIVVNLDSVRVVATRTKYPEFAEHQKFNIFGKLLGPEEMERQHVIYASEIIEKLPGFRIVGDGHRAQVVDATQASFGTCKANIVVDGVQDYEINDVPVAEIAAIEAYRAIAPIMPMEYHGGCGGLIIIWTKR